MAYLTREYPGIGGTLKAEPEDFRVDEIPLYPPSGAGEHLLLRIRKRQRTTHEVAALLAKNLGVLHRDVGFAGIKDSRAVTTQWFSVPVRAASRLDRVRWEGVTLLESARHHNKLRSGHLTGNRFDILVRRPRKHARRDAETMLETLQQRGVPNYFGAQRFGSKGDNDETGRCLVNSDYDGALRWYLGAPSDLEGDARIHSARQLFEEGRLEEALAAWPPRQRNEARVLESYLRQRNAKIALSRIPKSLRLLFVSAYQSRLFNRCLDQRLDRIDRVLEGDVAVKHSNLAAFVIEDPAAEQTRVDRFEISPAGPLFGPGLLPTKGEAGKIEAAIFAADHLDPIGRGSPFRDVHLKGERRPYRFPLRDTEVEEQQGGLRIRFELPRGCYATTVLAELMKPESDSRS